MKNGDDFGPTETAQSGIMKRARRPGASSSTKDDAKPERPTRTWMRARDAASYCATSLREFSAWVDDGLLAPDGRSGPNGAWLFHRDNLDAFLRRSALNERSESVNDMVARMVQRPAPSPEDTYERNIRQTGEEFATSPTLILPHEGRQNMPTPMSLSTIGSKK